jgi:hypothetical protein
LIYSITVENHLFLFQVNQFKKGDPLTILTIIKTQFLEQSHQCYYKAGLIFIIYLFMFDWIKKVILATELYFDL